MAEKTQKKQRSLSTPIRVIGQWLDSDFRREELLSPESLPDQMNWERTLPFIFSSSWMSCRFSSRFLMDLGRFRNFSLPFANVRHHRLLPSLLFSS